MARAQKVHTAGFKAKVAVAAVKELETLSQLASRYDLCSFRAAVTASCP